MNRRIGSCSLCGGDVYGHEGGWWSVQPPPSPTCVTCGATTRDDRIEMVPRRRPERTGTAATNWQRHVTQGGKAE